MRIHFFIIFDSFWIFKNKVSGTGKSINSYLCYYCQLLGVYLKHFEICCRRVARPVNLFCIHVFIIFNSFWIFKNKVSGTVKSIISYLFYYCQLLEVYLKHFEICCRRVARPVNLFCMHIFIIFNSFWIFKKNASKTVKSIISYLFYYCQLLEIYLKHYEICLRRVTGQVN